MKWLFAAAAAVTIATGGTALAAKLTTADVMKSYDKTDKVESCLNLQEIDQTYILDKKHILFKLYNGKRYMNELPIECPGLTPYRAIAYKTSINKLCNVDIITVFEAAQPKPNSYGSCGLGKFTLLQKKADATGPDGTK